MARTITLLDLRDEIGTLTQTDGATGRWSVARVNRRINMSISRFRAKLASFGISYYLKTQSGTLTSGTATVAVPADHVQTEGISVAYQGSDYYPLEPWSWEHRDLYDEAQGGYGQPLGYRVMGDSMTIYPIPQGDYPYRWHYLPTHTDLSSDTDTFDGVSGWENWVIADVSQYILTAESDGERLGAVLQIKAEAEAELNRYAARRTRDPGQMGGAGHGVLASEFEALLSARPAS